MHYVADDVIALLQWGCTESSSKEHCLAPICYWLDSSMSLIIACAAMLVPPRTPSKKLSAAIRAEGKLSNKKSLDDWSHNKIKQPAFFIFIPMGEFE